MALFAYIDILQRQNRRKETNNEDDQHTPHLQINEAPGTLYISPSGVIFTNIDVVATKGYGEKEHPNAPLVFNKNKTEQCVINASVKISSLIYITGDLDNRPYPKKDASAFFQ